MKRRARAAPVAIATAIGRGRCWEASAGWKIEVPRARLNSPDGKTTEWKSKALGPNSSSSMEHRGSKTRSPPCGTACRSSAVQCISTGTCWRTRLSGCARRSRRLQRLDLCGVREETKRPQSIHPKMAAQHRAVADSLEEAGDRLFTFTRLPPSQWRSVRTTNAIERLHEEFKRRIKTQTVLPSADTAAMLFWALLASGQINMRKVDGWQTLATNPSISQLTSPPDPITSSYRRLRRGNSNHMGRSTTCIPRNINLVRLAKLAVLTLQGLQLLGHIGRNARPRFVGYETGLS